MITPASNVELLKQSKKESSLNEFAQNKCSSASSNTNVDKCLSTNRTFKLYKAKPRLIYIDEEIDHDNNDNGDDDATEEDLFEEDDNFRWSTFLKFLINPSIAKAR